MNRFSYSKILISGFSCLTLTSCGVVIHNNIERQGDDERLATLQSMTDAELCSGYNNSLVKPKTERDIEKILKERKIGRCDARGRIRTIPLDIASNTIAGSRPPNTVEVATKTKSDPTPVITSAPTTATNTAPTISTPQALRATPPPTATCASSADHFWQ